MKRFRSTRTMLLGAACCWAQGAGAQVMPPAASAASEASQTTLADPVARPGVDSSIAPVPSAGTNEIVVTARRRGETLQAVPVVVSVQDAQTLARYNATDLKAIGELTPTVIVGTYKGQGGGTIAMRGISTPANQAGFEQAVSVAIDGVQTSNGRVAQLGFFDLQQVEVLKGPQALFFGKNSSAGVISVTSAGPTDRFQASLKTSYEFVADEVVTEAAISGPLSDTLGARVAVRFRNMEGYLRNTARPLADPFYNPATGAPVGASQLPGTSNPRPGDQEFLGRGTLVFKPSDTFSATFRILGTHATDSGAGVASQNIGPCSDGRPRVSGIPDPNGECVVDNRTTVGDVSPTIASTIVGANPDGHASGRFDAIITSLNISADVGKFNITSLTGYNYNEYSFFGGLDQTTFSQLAIFENPVQHEVSEEIRLSSKFAGRFNFMVGAFFQKSDLDVYADSKINDGNYNAAANRYVFEQYVSEQRGHTTSAFAQATLDITPQVQLAGGARYTREVKDYRKFNPYGIGTFNTAAFNFPGSNETGVLKGHFADNNVSPEVTLRWRPTSLITIFGGYRSGFKSGGFGLTNPLQTTTRIGDVDYESERSHGFEIGGRGRFLEGRLSISGAAFAYSFDNLQVNVYDPSRIAYIINNAGSVRQRGFELESSLAATSNLTLHGAIAYVDNKFRNFVGQCYSYTFPTGTTRATAVAPPNCSFVNSTALTLQQVYDGRAPARSPRWSGNSGFVLGVPIGDHRAELTGDAFYSSSYYAADTLVYVSRQSAFWRLNASISIASDRDERWKLGLIGRNLTNRYYLLYAADRTGGAGVPGAIGEQRGVVSRGREIMVQGSIKF